MDISDSAQVRNRISVRSILIVVTVYLLVSFSTAGLFLLVAAVCALLTSTICKNEVKSAQAGDNVFKKNYPLSHFGESFGDFQHVYHFDRSLEADLTEAISTELSTRTPASTLQQVRIVDVDSDLKQSESRRFLTADGGNTKRGTTVSLVVYFSQFGGMQSVRWWVLAGGFVDRDKRFNLIAYSPFTIWFWIISYLKKEYDILSRIRNRYPAFYNSLDVSTRVRCIHEAVFSALVEELEKHGIDTSELSTQRSEMLNINISGGDVKMGNVVQGAMNKITANMQPRAMG